MNNNNNNGNRVTVNIAGMCLGIMIGITAAGVMFEFQDIMPLLIVLVVSGPCYLAVVLIQEFLQPYLKRRDAAIKALGKDGIKIMRHDYAAKLAYKGIYALIGGKYPDAEDYLQKALSNSTIRQNQKFCLEWLIKLYETKQDNAKLMWCFRKAVEYTPDDAGTQSRLGHAYLTEGDLDRAEYCFNEALKYSANDGYPYYSLVRIALIRGDYDKAHELLETLMKVNGNHPLAHAEYASYYAMTGDSEKAQEECKKAQICGYKDPEELNRRIKAMLSFEDTQFSGEDLPKLYYRRIESKGGEKNA